MHHFIPNVLPILLGKRYPLFSPLSPHSIYWPPQPLLTHLYLPPHTQQRKCAFTTHKIFITLHALSPVLLDRPYLLLPSQFAHQPCLSHINPFMLFDLSECTYIDIITIYPLLYNTYFIICHSPVYTPSSHLFPQPWSSALSPLFFLNSLSVDIDADSVDRPLYISTQFNGQALSPPTPTTRFRTVFVYYYQLWIHFL